MHLYWTSLSHFEEVTLSSSLHLQAGSSCSGNYQAGISINIFDITPWVGPLVQYWEVLSHPVK